MKPRRQKSPCWGSAGNLNFRQLRSSHCFSHDLESTANTDWGLQKKKKTIVLLFFLTVFLYWGIANERVFPAVSGIENLPANARDAGSIPGSGKSPGEGNGYPLQYSYPGMPRNIGAWRATVHGVTKNWTRLSN